MHVVEEWHKIGVGDMDDFITIHGEGEIFWFYNDTKHDFVETENLSEFLRELKKTLKSWSSK